MNNKKIGIIAIGLIVGFISIGSIFYINSNKDTNKADLNTTTNVNDKLDNDVEVESEVIKFLKSISGVKANNLEIIDDPVGFKTQLLAPKHSILSGVDYFLENTENDKMKNLSIDIGEGFIKIKVNYEVIPNIDTPIEVKVIPTLSTNKDLVLNIEEVKFLDLKIAKWIVDMGINNFIKDWFPKERGLDVDFNEGKVIVYKENFEGIYLEGLLIDENGLTIDTIIDLETIVASAQSNK